MLAHSILQGVRNDTARPIPYKVFHAPHPVVFILSSTESLSSLKPYLFPILIPNSGPKMSAGPSGTPPTHYSDAEFRHQMRQIFIRVQLPFFVDGQIPAISMHVHETPLGKCPPEVPTCSLGSLTGEIKLTAPGTCLLPI